MYRSAVCMTPMGVNRQTGGNRGRLVPVSWTSDDVAQADALRRIRGATTLTEETVGDRRFLSGTSPTSRPAGAERSRAWFRLRETVSTCAMRPASRSSAPAPAPLITSRFGPLIFRTSPQPMIGPIASGADASQCMTANISISIYVREPGGTLLDMVRMVPACDR